MSILCICPPCTATTLKFLKWNVNKSDSVNFTDYIRIMPDARKTHEEIGAHPSDVSPWCAIVPADTTGALACNDFRMYLSLRLSIYLSMYLSISPCIDLCIYRCIYLSLYLSIYLSVCLSLCLSICLSFCLSICLAIYLSISSTQLLSLSLFHLITYLSIYLPVCLSLPFICLSV